jgi:hypothetical protein
MAEKRNYKGGTDVEYFSNVLAMKQITRHIKLLGSLAALLFTLGSSGVAIVVHSCTMAPKMECCQNMDADRNIDCSEGQTAGVPAIQLDMTCSTSTLVGCLTTNPGVVDNNRPVQNVSAVVVPLAGCTSRVQTVTSPVSILPGAASISPPSVAKHILNASLLI